MLTLYFHKELLGKETSYGPVDALDILILAAIKHEETAEVVKEIGNRHQLLLSTKKLEEIDALRTVGSSQGSRVAALSILNRVTGRSFRTLPRGIKATLDKFTVTELESALSSLVKDPWHKERIKTLGPEYLLRETTIDRWLNVANTQTQPNTLNEEPLVTI